MDLLNNHFRRKHPKFIIPDNIEEKTRLLHENTMANQFKNGETNPQSFHESHSRSDSPSISSLKLSSYDGNPPQIKSHKQHNPLTIRHSLPPDNSKQKRENFDFNHPAIYTGEHDYGLKKMSKKMRRLKSPVRLKKNKQTLTNRLIHDHFLV